MLNKIGVYFCIAVFLMCFSGMAQSETGLPKSPNWLFGTEIPHLDKGRAKHTVPPRGWNDLTENQEIINSWGYKARPIEEIKDLLPEAFYNMISDPESWGDFRINETKFIPNRGPYWEAYEEATRKYKGTCRLDEQGWLYDYKAGQPFPDVDIDKDPQGVDKVMWNFLKRFANDDRKVPGITNIRDQAGNIRNLIYDNIRFNFNGRLELDPKPLYQPNPKQIDYIYSLPFTEPYAMRGTVPLIQRYAIPRDFDMWMYLPAMRRVRRMATTQTQDKLPGGMDVTWDAAEGFMGNVLDFELTYLGKKELLIPLVASEVPQLDVTGLCGVDQYYQRRDCYIIKATYKKPITITDIIVHVDSELYYNCYTVCVDMRGNDWMFQSYFRGRDKDWFQLQNSMNLIDVQRHHATRGLLSWYYPNYGYSASDFTMPQLIKEYSAR